VDRKRHHSNITKSEHCCATPQDTNAGEKSRKSFPNTKATIAQSPRLRTVEREMIRMIWIPASAMQNHKETRSDARRTMACQNHAKSNKSQLGSLWFEKTKHTKNKNLVGMHATNPQLLCAPTSWLLQEWSSRCPDGKNETYVNTIATQWRSFTCTRSNTGDNIMAQSQISQNVHG
jgi:hypothetical protein